MIVGLAIYFGLGAVCLLITIFGFKFPPRGSDAIMKAFIMISGWIVICPLLWWEIIDERNNETIQPRA